MSMRLRIDPYDLPTRNDLPADAVNSRPHGRMARTRTEGRDQSVVCGVYGHVGILATVLNAYSDDLEVSPPGDAIGHLSAADHRRTAEYTARRCAAVTTADELQS
ncbi:isochorismatase family protein [Streptomyces niveus]|uniref:isochorismatase family protein n=1 Tax=Streptomyces niveus TaxID=193462 RepID=UPI0033F90864